jgi:hypothetical protein
MFTQRIYNPDILLKNPCRFHYSNYYAAKLNQKINNQNNLHKIWKFQNDTMGAFHLGEAKDTTISGIRQIIREKKSPTAPLRVKSWFDCRYPRDS